MALLAPLDHIPNIQGLGFTAINAYLNLLPHLI
jgi:hypothetical protein